MKNERISSNDEFYKEFFDSSHLKLKEHNNKKYDSNKIDKEREKITKPIIIKHQIGSIRQKSASVIDFNFYKLATFERKN